MAQFTGFSSFSKQNYTIEIDYDRDDWLPTVSKVKFKEGKYLIGPERSPQEGMARAAIAYASNQAHAQRLYHYVSNRWFMYASPVLASAGNERGLPISCFVPKVGDSVESISKHNGELMRLSTAGGGVGQDWSAVRSVGTATSKGTSTPGLIPFLKGADSLTLASVQGEVRRGSTAVYLDVSHPEIREFLHNIRPAGGADPNRQILNLFTGVNITDKFMIAVEKGEPWDLIDPHTKKVTETVSARELWDAILVLRIERGYPYLHFVDTANRALPKVLKDKGYQIFGSNLCSEIELPTSPERTAICCLSSVNAELFDYWKDNPDFIGDIIEMLDNVVEVFLQKTDGEWGYEFSRASASGERPLGLGLMGLHSYLQKHRIPFESPMAVGFSNRVFKHLKEQAVAKSRELGLERGEPTDLQTTLTISFTDGTFIHANSSEEFKLDFGSKARKRAFELVEGDEINGKRIDGITGLHDLSGRRNSHLLAVAPNASSGQLCGNPSPGIEPFTANVFIQKTAVGTFFIRNKHLDKLLQVKYSLEGEALENVWDDILANNGSVQHLDFMEDEDKEVYKTAFELDQGWIIEHASIRAPHICQGQSVNLFIHPEEKMSYIRSIHRGAWKKGLKALYYVRSKNIAKAKSTSYNSDTCQSCSG